MRFFADPFNYYCKLHQANKNLPFLIMLHGFMGNGHVFDHLIEDLCAFCNPLTIDLAGHGETESPTQPEFYSVQRQVGQHYSILKRLGFDNLYLYGYSMGGRLAFHLISSHPDFFKGVVIESAHCGIESGEVKKLRKKLDEKRADEIETNFDSFIDQWIEMPLFQHTPAELLIHYREIMRHQKPEKMSASLRSFGAGVMPEVCEQIKKLLLPITLIAGELDQKYVKMMSKIEQDNDMATLHIIRNAGHRVHTDQPNELIRILKISLSEN